MEGSSNPNSIPTLDDCYAALFDGQVSDEEFAEELQLQEVIFSSILASQPHPPAQTPVPSSLETVMTPATPEEVVTAAGEASSSSRRTFCEICMEEKTEASEMFENRDCSHVHCKDCISRHITAKIQENLAMARCPGLECKGLLAPELCRPLLPAEVMARWEAALAEAMILGSQRFHCPFEDCSALLVDDGGGAGAVTEAECPECKRLFCAQCKVAWHSGVTCEEFWALNADEKGRDDLMVLELAKTKGWRRCPRCRYYVETTGGCPHMVCRCQFEFCYRCGSAWSDVHGASCEATGDGEGLNVVALPDAA